MTHDEQIRLMLDRMAELAAGPSTLRGRPTGTVFKARKFLKHVKPQQFKVRDEENFRRQLDTVTKKFLAHLDWGAARKILNVFLRDVLFNHSLRAHFKFGEVEKWLEVPLDADAAKGLLAEPEGKNLPSWKGIINLESEVSRQYQDVAKQVAARHGICRVQLDLIYWRPGRYKNNSAR